MSNVTTSIPVRGEVGLSCHTSPLFAFSVHGEATSWYGEPEPRVVKAEVGVGMLPNPFFLKKTKWGVFEANGPRNSPGKSVFIGGVDPFSNSTWARAQSDQNTQKERFLQYVNGGPIAFAAKGDVHAQYAFLGDATKTAARAEADRLGYDFAANFRDSYDDVVSAVKKAQSGLCAYYLEPSGEPVAKTLDRGVKFYGQSYNVRKTEGSDVVEFEFHLPMYVDPVSKLMRMGRLENATNDFPDSLAAKAVEKANRELVKAHLARASGQPFEPPSLERPAATLHPDLSDSVRQNADDWWSAYEKSVRSLTELPVTTEDEAWANYVSSGGTKNRDQWKAGISTAVDTARDGESLANSGKSVFGEAWDSTKNGLEWLGDATFDLLKSWGPMGTVGAYAGVKAVDKTSSMPKWVLPAVAIGGAILLLK